MLGDNSMLNVTQLPIYQYYVLSSKNPRSFTYVLELKSSDYPQLISFMVNGDSARRIASKNIILYY